MAGVANRVQDAIELDGAELEGADGALDLAGILEPGVNLAEHLSDEQLGRIGSDVIRDVEIDERSRGRGSKGADDTDWLARYRKWLDMAMQVRSPKNFPWFGASNVKVPLLTVASIQFQARAYPAIVDGQELVKGRVLGPDPDGQKRARAERMGQHMTWQLLYRMPGWEEDTDRLLLMLPIVGSVFRKTYYDSILNVNRSEMVSAEDFIVNYWTKSLETAPRFTHVLRYYPHEVMEKVAAGLWLAIAVDPEGANSDDESALVDFYEQHRLIDLDGDGYPEPYVVTTNKEGEVARIVPCFGPDEVTVMNLATGKPVALAKVIEAANEDERAWELVGDVVKIERRQYFTKYGFIPSPDGSFYDIGFGSLLEDLLEPINTAVNQMLDAGALQNAQGGFLGSGVNIRGGNMAFRLGEWKRVDTTAGTLRDNVFPLNTPGPSAVLFNLLTLLIESAKEITSVQDVMTGEGTAGQPATTTLALIEQGHKTMTAIFKRVHRAFGQELRILRRLNRDYLDEEEYFQLNDSQPEQETDEAGQPIPQEPQRIGRQDYQDADLDVVPVSDPATVSDQHKMARVQALMAFAGNPLVNQEEIVRLSLSALGFGAEIKPLMKVAPPPPDPKMLLDRMKEARAKEETGAKVRALDSASAQKLTDAAVTLAGLGLLEDAAQLAAVATELGGAADDDLGEGGVPAMAGGPGNGGVPGPVGLPPGGFDGGMGGGGGFDPGAAGAGGDLGTVGADQI